MKKILERSFISLITVLLFTHCNKDIECDTATLCVRNNTNAFVPYGWNGNQITDTLSPGECAIYTFQDLEVKYRFGQQVSSNIPTVYFTTEGGEYKYDIYDCVVEETVPAPTTGSYLGCGNGQFNPEFGELDTDCGGNCMPCDTPQFSCQVPAKTLMVGSASLSAGSASINESFYGDFEANVYLSNGTELSISIHLDELPQETRKFVIGDDQQELSMMYLTSTATYQATPTQEVYLLKEDAGYRLVFCDVEVKNPDASFNLSGDLTITH